MADECTDAPPLPWWQRILVDDVYRARLTELASTIYRAELRLLQQTPHLLTPPLPNSDAKKGISESFMAQYVSLPAGTSLALRHPDAVAQVSTFARLRRTAVECLPPAADAAQHSAQVQAVEDSLEAQRQRSQAKTREGLYGLSHVWSGPLPPSGFIRLTPDPRRAMWPDHTARRTHNAAARLRSREMQDLAATVNARNQHKQLLQRHGWHVGYAVLLKRERRRQLQQQQEQEQPDGVALVAAPHAERVPPIMKGPLHINVLDTSGAKPRCIGCYRQSLLLLHYKIYCCALHEEQRLRCGGPLAHVLGSLHRAAPLRSSASDSKQDASLQDVPVVPRPVLRIQECAPHLQASRRAASAAADLTTVQPARCWVGLIDVPPADPADPARKKWVFLHRHSPLARQAIADVFDELPHNAEGCLERPTYLAFIAYLTQLFLPVHLSEAVRDISEEEWAYRGTSDLVSLAVFEERFFSFPFVFLRDIARVTEEAYVQFWLIVHLGLTSAAVPRHESSSGARPATTARSQRRRTSPLAPLSGFSRAQVQRLIHRTASVASATVMSYLTCPRTATRPREKHAAASTCTVSEPESTKASRVLPAIGGQSTAHATAPGQRHAKLLREEDARQLEQLLANSVHYQRRHRKAETRLCETLSRLHETTSTWEMQNDTVYHVPPRAHDEEEALLDYLGDVEPEVFDTSVPLRERYRQQRAVEEHRRTTAGRPHSPGVQSKGRDASQMQRSDSPEAASAGGGSEAEVACVEDAGGIADQTVNRTPEGAVSCTAAASENEAVADDDVNCASEVHSTSSSTTASSPSRSATVAPDPKQPHRRHRVRVIPSSAALRAHPTYKSPIGVKTAISTTTANRF